MDFGTFRYSVKFGTQINYFQLENSQRITNQQYLKYKHEIIIHSFIMILLVGTSSPRKNDNKWRKLIKFSSFFLNQECGFLLPWQPLFLIQNTVKNEFLYFWNKKNFSLQYFFPIKLFIQLNKPNSVCIVYYYWFLDNLLNVMNRENEDIVASYRGGAKWVYIVHAIYQKCSFLCDRRWREVL